MRRVYFALFIATYANATELIRAIKMDFFHDSSTFHAIGIATIVSVFAKVFYNLYTHYVIYFQNSEEEYRRFGRWALVTGATDGIGKGIARELAKRGLSVVLVSRNPEKLGRVAREIESEFQVETQCVAIDFTHSDRTCGEMTPSVYDVISNAIRDLEVGILVNNVGMGSGKPNRFLNCYNAKGDGKILVEGNMNLINCNVMSQVKVTQIVLPEMVKRGKGLIINVSSVAARIVLPTGAMYSSSKRFNDHFSRALSFEYEENGIIVQSLQPAFVDTNLANSAVDVRKSLFAPSWKKYANHTMRSVGKVQVNHGYWLHALQVWLMSWIPQNTMAAWTILAFRTLDTRKRNDKVSDKHKKYE